MGFFSSSGSLLPVWIWIIIVVIMCIIEASTMGLITIWFAGGALAAAVVSLFTGSIMIQLLVFVVVSLVLVYFTRPIAVKKLNNKTEKTNADAVIGTKGIVESDIKPELRGSVRADGKVWTAIASDADAEIKKGDTVIIERIEGVKLIVRKENI